MKTWKKMISGFLATLILLTTLAAPAAAAPGIQRTMGAIDDQSTVLPYILTMYNDGSSDLTTDTLTITVTDNDGLLTGSSGSTFQLTYNVGQGTNTPIAAGSTAKATINLGLAAAPVAGTDYRVTVQVAASGSGGFGALSETDNFVITPTVSNPAELQEGLVDDINLEKNYAPGDSVDVEIVLDNANIDYTDVTVEAWITDPSGDRVGDKEETKEFNMNADNDKETIDLSFKLPSDLDEGEYTLNIVVDSDQGVLDLDSSETFDVERADNSLYFESIDFGTTAVAGQTVDFAVSLFNNGLEDEDSLRTSITISGVGVSQTSDYFTIDRDDDAKRYFTLALPSTMSTGEYQVTLRTWNDNVDVYETRELTVTGTTGVTPGASGFGVSSSVDATSKLVHTVTGGAYVVSVTNNGNVVSTYTVSVAGTEGWATSLLNPATVTLAPGATGQVSVFVSPSEDASGLHQFSVYVKDGTTIVDSLSLTANVVAEESSSLDVLNTSTSALAIVIVLLVVLWVWKREGTPRAPIKRKGGRKKEVYY